MKKEFEVIAADGKNITVVVRLSDNLIFSIYRKYFYNNNESSFLQIASFDQDLIHCKINNQNSIKKINIKNLLLENGKVKPLQD